MRRGRIKTRSRSGQIDVGAALSRVEIRIGKRSCKAFEVLLIDTQEAGREERTEEEMVEAI